METIFVHGLGQNSSSWDKVFSHTRITGHCPDLTAFLTRGQASYGDLYQAFSAYCNGFDGPLKLCGLSLGAVLALHYTLEHPGKVHSLVLMGAQYKMPRALLKFQNLLFRIMPAGSFTSMGFSKAEFLSLCSSMAELDFSDDLGKVPCQTLVLCGEKDKANRRAAIHLAEKIPDAGLKLIDGAGHEVNVEAPAELASALSQFFAGNE